MTIELVRFNVLRNALYHTSRRMSFERWSRWCNLLVILLGASAIGQLWESSSYPVNEIVGALTAFVGAIQLVFDFGGKARDHQALQRSYYHLLAEIEEVTEPDAAAIARFQASMTRIAGDEPPMLRALDAKAYNDAIAGTDFYPMDRRIVIPWWHRFIGQFWAFEGYDYKLVCEVTPPSKR